MLLFIASHYKNIDTLGILTIAYMTVQDPSM